MFIPDSLTSKLSPLNVSLNKLMIDKSKQKLFININYYCYYNNIDIYIIFERSIKYLFRGYLLNLKKSKYFEKKKKKS